MCPQATPENGISTVTDIMPVTSKSILYRKAGTTTYTCRTTTGITPTRIGIMIYIDNMMKITVESAIKRVSTNMAMINIGTKTTGIIIVGKYMIVITEDTDGGNV
jgi:sorbitol-specific phosphotransferase system component IIC